jgi:hypothetical protein
VHIAGEDITNLDGLSILTSVRGNMVIGDHFGANSSLSSLTGLDSLTTIGGSLDVRHNDILTNLAGLDNLTYIGGNLSIYDNHDLANLTGLEGLNYLPGNLSIGIYFLGGNFSLTDLTGLDNLASIGGNLSIAENSALTTLTGLEMLTNIGASFVLNENYDLVSLTALESLTHLGGNLSIKYNRNLNSLMGLDRLTSVNGGLSVVGNPVLTNLTGLDGLASIGGDLRIIWNYDLTNLTGLNNIDAGSISALFIYQNSMLSTCHVQSICDYLAAPNGDIHIHDNDPGCNSQEEVEEACGMTGTDEFQVPGSGLQVEVYPNPAEREVFVSVSSQQSAVGSHFRLTILDLFGRVVPTMMDEMKSPGEYSVRIDVSGLPAGVYLVRVQTGEQRAVRKLVVR